MMGSVNYLTTIIQMRAPGMTMFRLPLTIWAMFITAILQAFALPVLTAAGFMQLSDRLLSTGFFLPEGAMANNSAMATGGGQPLLWQHLFWFYSHPAVYIMILPAMGMVSDMIACFSRKPIFGYRPMVYSISGIAGLGFIVWGHHMFVSGMSPYLGMSFMVATMMIALPSAVKVFNWLGTVWGGKIQFTTPMLFALSFVSMFIIGGLSGIFMAATPVDIFIHDTYFIVAHFHYVLFASTAGGLALRPLHECLSLPRESRPARVQLRLLLRRISLGRARADDRLAGQGALGRLDAASVGRCGQPVLDGRGCDRRRVRSCRRQARTGSLRRRG